MPTRTTHKSETEILTESREVSKHCGSLCPDLITMDLGQVHEIKKRRRGESTVYLNVPLITCDGVGHCKNAEATVSGDVQQTSNQLIQASLL